MENKRAKGLWREQEKHVHSKLTQVTGLRHIIDISIHFLCFDQIAGHKECIPFCNTHMNFSKDMQQRTSQHTHLKCLNRLD
jgi:hypothetical protein